MHYSYKRVSTEHQDLRRQDDAFKGIQIDREYCDKLTGKNTERPGLNKLRLEVQKGDSVYIESISRLGRNVDDLRQLVQEFKDKGVAVHFIKEGISTNGNMYKFLLTTLGAVAEMERDISNERVKEGIAKARKYGTRSGKPIGRPAPELPKVFPKYYYKWKEGGDITATEFARLIGVSRPTLYRYISIYEQEVSNG